MTGMAAYRRLLGYARPYWRLFVVATAAMAVNAATQPGFAAVMKPLMDDGFVSKDPATMRWIPFVIVGLFLVRGLSAFGSDFAMAWVGRHVVKALRRDLFSHLLRLPTSFFDKIASGQIISKLTFDVERVAQSTTDAVTVVVRDGLTIIGLLAFMLYVSPVLTVVFLVVAPPLVWLINAITRRFRRISRRIQGTVGDVAEVAEEAVHGERIVKTFGGHDYEARHFERANEANRHQNMKLTVTKSASVPVVHFIAACALAAVVYLATLPSVVSNVTAGDFVSFITAITLLLSPLRRLTSVNATLQQGVAAATSLFEVIDTAPEPDHGTRRLERARGHIEYRDVTFSYEAQATPVLDDVSFTVEPGQTVAVVGRSGAGKSTLANLLPRFYDPRAGEVRLDGVAVSDYRLADLRAQMALVSQEVTLFNDTVARNIAYGALSEAGEGDIVEAAEAAHAMDFIRELPQGLETVIGEHGVLLSGGQRQRIAIARALLKKAPILVLDEATSSLDAETERDIQAALDALMRESTTLVIAHRLSTVERADQIVVLEQGRVAEMGRHAELLERDGPYASLHRLQFRSQALSSVG